MSLGWAFHAETLFTCHPLHSKRRHRRPRPEIKMSDDDSKPNLLALRGIRKGFPGVQALDGVDLSLKRRGSCPSRRKWSG